MHVAPVPYLGEELPSGLEVGRPQALSVQSFRPSRQSSQILKRDGLTTRPLRGALSIRWHGAVNCFTTWQLPSELPPHL